MKLVNHGFIKNEKLGVVSHEKIIWSNLPVCMSSTDQTADIPKQQPTKLCQNKQKNSNVTTTVVKQANNRGVLSGLVN